MRFDVLVVKSADQKVIAVTGRNLDEKRAEKREETTISRTNIGDYFVSMAPAGVFDVGSTFRLDV